MPRANNLPFGCLALVTLGLHFFGPDFLGLRLLGPASARASDGVESVGVGPPEAQDFFESDIRPLLSTACWGCHGPDEQSGGLRLDSRGAILRGGENGPAAVPGESAASLLVLAVQRTAERQMPPDDSLTEQQVQALVRWVDLGMPWGGTASSDTDRGQGHWAFQPISDPPVPRGTTSEGESGTALAQSSPSESAIDAFIDARLSEHGLSPVPRADKRVLIRRLSMDLTGLLPSESDVQAFLSDTRADAYPRLVDRFLASPLFGEHWARHWLDVARYSDSKGYVYGREERFWVHAWGYRDWVVRSLNEDMPYDRFLALQIAADQVAPDDPRHWSAMGFLTLGRRFLGIPHDIIDDRIDVLTRGTMGLTVACARCHSHKYDPIPTDDYYSLYGIFRSSCEKLVSAGTSGSHFESGAVTEYEEGLRQRQGASDRAMAEEGERHARRVRQRVRDYLQAQFELEKYPRDGFDQFILPIDTHPVIVRHWQDYLSRMARDGDPIFVPWHRYAEIAPQDWSTRVPHVHRELTSGSVAVHPRVLALFAEPPASRDEMVDRYAQLFGEVAARWEDLQCTAHARGEPDPQSFADMEWDSLRRVLYGEESPCEVPREPISESERFFTSSVVVRLWKLQGEVDRWINASTVAPAHAMLLVDRQRPHDPHVFRRGNPLQQGEQVPRQFLQCLAGPNRQPFRHGSGRLELAQSIIHPDNPLTARVIVNRIWQHHFGRGLVDTPSDFGTRAPPPSHPELLDWLATRLIREGWSLKGLHRRIVLSSAYQRASSGPGASAEVARALRLDPENRWLWRRVPHRLSFEEMRDALFGVTDGLRLQIGGKAADLLTGDFRRRTLYGKVDRQFLPDTFRTFDFANPDLHIPMRRETTVPQQGLFFLNDRLVLDRAAAVAERVTQRGGSDQDQVAQMYECIYQRRPSAEELSAALGIVQGEVAEEVAPDSAQESRRLSPWAQLAQVLLASNEFLFID